MNFESTLKAEAIVNRVDSCLRPLTSAEDRRAFQDAIVILAECRIFAAAIDSADSISPGQRRQHEQRLLQVFTRS